MRPSFHCALGLLLAASTLAPAQSLDPPAGQRLLLYAEGRGVQVYRCDAKGDGAAWTFVEPQAELFSGSDKIGTHGAGPVWTHNDGSIVHGKLVVSRAAPTAGAIPWLLLKAAETTGKGVFTPVTYIRRTETKGGQADPAACDASRAGSTTRVPYTATYSFYAAAN